MSDPGANTDGDGDGVFEPTVRAGVCQLRRSETRWLSTGWGGGDSHGSAAYNVTVPEGWPETDLAAYVASRREEAGFDAAGPTLLTGVSQEHARRARLGSVEAVATAGVSNPAALPVERRGGAARDDSDGGGDDHASATGDAEETIGAGELGDTSDSADDRPLGTVNVVVGTTRALAPGALPNLLTVAAEAKAATLLSVAGVPGTTTDAVVAACDPDGSLASFSGSATPVGRAARACVRDAVLASLDSRYAQTEIPTVEGAPYGVVTDERATVTEL